MNINLLKHGQKGLRRRFPSISLLTALKVVILAIPIFVCITLLNSNFFFSRTLSYTYRAGMVPHVVFPMMPTLFKTADPAMPWRITSDSFPIGLNFPRLFDTVRVQARLIPGTQAYVAFHAKAKTGGDFSTMVSSSVLDQLDWPHVTDGVTTLWMRPTSDNLTNRQYSSLADFRADPPDLTKVATAGFDRMAFVSIPNYVSSLTPIVLDHTFRGSHQMYVYAADEQLHLKFDKYDLNRKAGADRLTIRIIRTDQVTGTSRPWMKTLTIPDDGNVGSNGRRSAAQVVELSVPDVRAGVYLVDIVASDDVIFSHLNSWQKYLTFVGRTVLADGPAYSTTPLTPMTLTVDGPTLTISANHDQGKQTVTIAGKKYTINDLKENHVTSTLPKLSSTIIAKGDVTLTTTGLLTISPARSIPDSAQTINLAAKPNLSSYRYVLANYQPRTSGDIIVDETYIVSDLAFSGANGKRLIFSVESSGLQASGATLGLRDIHVTMTRGSFPWNKVWDKLLHRPTAK